MTKARLINKALKAARVKKGLTQLEVAKDLGLTTSQYVSNYERELCYPSMATINHFINNNWISRKNAEEMLVKEYRINLWRKIQEL